MEVHKRKGLRTWIEIDRKAIAHNFKIFRSLISKKTSPHHGDQVKLMAVVKSNAYGHSLHDFAKEMEALGADFFGVDSVIEALALRDIGIKIPILVLGYTLTEMLAKAVKADVAITVSTFETLEAILKLRTKRQAKIHIKVDTGMHRQGFLPQDLPKILARLVAGSTKFRVEGLFTHFAAAKRAKTRDYTLKQISSFKRWIEAFQGVGLDPICHASATAGALLYPEAHFDMVRVGIGLYGLWPDDHVRKNMSSEITLEPILSWKTIITEIKKLPRGAYVGYDMTEKLKRDSTVGICPIGYWHGLPRELSGKGFVLVKDRRAKILGRVSMDMIAIDLTDVQNPKVEDEVTLIGGNGAGLIGAEEMAEYAHTSVYEILTRLNPLMKRFYHTFDF